MRVKVDKVTLNRPLSVTERARERLADNQVIISDNQIVIIKQLDNIKDSFECLYGYVIGGFDGVNEGINKTVNFISNIFYAVFIGLCFIGAILASMVQG